MRKGYFGEPGAQIHYRVCEPKSETSKPPLLCLPASPHSGLYYTAVMETLSEDRTVYSVDYPGFGGSDPLAAAPSIETLAQSLHPLISSLGLVDVLGFHSGCLVGLELGLQIPDQIGRILMIDVPYFDAETRAKYGAGFAKPVQLPTSAADLENQFTAQVSKRSGDLGLERAYDLWAEMLRAGVGVNDIFRAAFSYPCEQKFTDIKKPIDVLATKSGLLEASRAAANVLSNVKFSENLNIDRAVFDLYAPQITENIKSILNS